MARLASFIFGGCFCFLCKRRPFLQAPGRVSGCHRRPSKSPGSFGDPNPGRAFASLLFSAGNLSVLLLPSPGGRFWAAPAPRPEPEAPLSPPLQPPFCLRPGLGKKLERESGERVS